MDCECLNDLSQYLQVYGFTPVWVLSCCCKLLHALWKRFLTMLTWIWLATSVNSFMTLQATRVLIWLATVRTEVLFDIGMSLFMMPQGAVECKNFLTMMAWIRLATSVSSFMYPEATRVFKWFATVCAQIPLTSLWIFLWCHKALWSGKFSDKVDNYTAWHQCEFFHASSDYRSIYMICGNTRRDTV